MQTVSQGFKNMVSNSFIPIDWEFKVSFDKMFDPNAKWLTLDESLLDSSDMLMPSDDNPLQEWFKYDFRSYKDRVIDITWTRELDFPYSVQSAMADITLDNTDKMFTPDSPSPIGGYILPKRPIIIYQGFKTVESVPQFVGLTQNMPTVNNTTASFHALDFMSELFELPLSNTIAMQDVTTDVVLKNIFQQMGLVPSQYSIPKGFNVIPFLFFDRGMTIGDAIRSVMQAEGGLLWLDENGIFRFTPRIETLNPVSYVIDRSNIINISVSNESGIINSVRVKSMVREVQPFQSIYSKPSSGDSTSRLWVIPKDGGKLTRSLELQDPSISAQLPTVGHASGISWFTVKDVEGNQHLNVTAVGELFTNHYEITFTNDNNFDVEVDELDLWGEPAMAIDEEGLIYELEVDASIEKFGRNVIEIDNDFIGTVANANSLSLMILDMFSEHRGRLVVNVKPNPALQLGDIVDIDYYEYSGSYKILKIVNTLSTNGQITQELTVGRYEIRDWFIISGDEPRSLLDSTAQLTY